MRPIERRDSHRDGQSQEKRSRDDSLSQADRIAEAASVEQDRDLYKAQLDVFPDFVPGGAVTKRPRALCPHCGSLERHRVLALVLEGLTPTLAAARIVLDVAPVPVLSRLLARDTGGLYLPIDIDPAADSRRVMMQADLTRIPLPDDSVDVIMCTQVLEHVPDDLAAMREIRRVLSPNGIAFVNIPFRPGTVTDEDPSAPVEERIRRFGQADHVRFYGDDFDDRLRAAGLGFVHTTGPELVGPELAQRIGLVDPLGKVGAELMVGEGMSFGAVFWIGHLPMAHTAKRAPEGARLPSTIAIAAYQRCAVYQSSMSLRTWSRAMP